MCFGFRNINFEYFHTIASFIKSLLHLRVILIPMARQMSKYTTGNKLWSLWGCFGYLCSLKNLRVKLTLSALITSFQTLPEIGLNRVPVWNCGYKWQDYGKWFSTPNWTRFESFSVLSQKGQLSFGMGLYFCLATNLKLSLWFIPCSYILTR